jgi:hypothetical protein
MKTKNIILHIALALVLLGVFPSYTYAAKLFINVPEKAVSVGDTILVKVMIDTEGKEINAVEGILNIDTPQAVTSINTGGSILNLWPIKPSLEKNTIVFTGGTTGGVFGSTLKLFTLAIKPTTQKPIKISFKEGTAYLNDGKGTKVLTTGSNIEIPVSPKGAVVNELDSLVSSDKIQPARFSIDLGRDSALYDGKYFISFYAIDNESGIDRYEVTEGTYPMVRSGSVYVLQNQNLSGSIEVKAIDNAGNTRIETITLPLKNSWINPVITLLLILITVIGVYLLKFRKKQ